MRSSDAHPWYAPTSCRVVICYVIVLGASGDLKFFNRAIGSIYCWQSMQNARVNAILAAGASETRVKTAPWSMIPQAALSNVPLESIPHHCFNKVMDSRMCVNGTRFGKKHAIQSSPQNHIARLRL